MNFDQKNLPFLCSLESSLMHTLKRSSKIKSLRSWNFFLQENCRVFAHLKSVFQTLGSWDHAKNNPKKCHKRSIVSKCCGQVCYVPTTYMLAFGPKVIASSYVFDVSKDGKTMFPIRHVSHNRIAWCLLISSVQRLKKRKESIPRKSLESCNGLDSFYEKNTKKCRAGSMC